MGRQKREEANYQAEQNKSDNEDKTRQYKTRRDR